MGSRENTKTLLSPDRPLSQLESLRGEGLTTTYQPVVCLYSEILCGNMSPHIAWNTGSLTSKRGLLDRTTL
jgi:hypothetical protein